MSQENIPSGQLVEIFDHEGFKIGWGIFLNEVEELARHQQSDLKDAQDDHNLVEKLYETYKQPIMGLIEFLQQNQKTEHDKKNGQIVHLLDGYIKDLELLDRLLPTSGISNKEILAPAVKDVLKRLYQIREAKP